MSNIEIIKPTNNQKASFKILSRDNIQLQMIPQIFNYNIGYINNDMSLSSFMTANIMSVGDASYHNIQRKFYEEQSYKVSDSSSSVIIPSSKFNSEIGESYASTIIAFSFKKFISKDGISNISAEKNIFINLSSVAYSHSLSSSLGFGLGDGRIISYVLYDKRISSTAGDIIMKILKPIDGGILSLSGVKVSDFRYDDSLVVGKIFYDYSLIVLDSLQSYQISTWTLSGDTYDYYVPYPITNSLTEVTPPEYETVSGGIIPIISLQFDNIVFNQVSITSSFAYYGFAYYDNGVYNSVDSSLGSASALIYSFNNSKDIIVINNVEVNFKLNKNSYIINVPILKKDFNYSGNMLRVGYGENIIPEATESNPIWFNKIGFYDYKHNLLGTANINIPIKNSNKRTMIIKIKIDY